MDTLCEEETSFGQRTSNIAESLNSVFSSIRDLPILSLCLEIHNYTMNVFFNRRVSSLSKTGWTNVISKTIRENATLGRRMEVKTSALQGLVMDFEAEFIVPVLAYIFTIGTFPVPMLSHSFYISTWSQLITLILSKVWKHTKA